MWLNVCDLTEKILLAKKTSKEVDFSDFIRTFVLSFCALLFYNAALRLGEKQVWLYPEFLRLWSVLNLNIVLQY